MDIRYDVAGGRLSVRVYSFPRDNAMFSFVRERVGSDRFRSQHVVVVRVVVADHLLALGVGLPDELVEPVGDRYFFFGIFSIFF